MCKNGKLVCIFWGGGGYETQRDVSLKEKNVQYSGRNKNIIVMLDAILRGILGHVHLQKEKAFYI